MQKQVLLFFFNEDEYITSYITKIALHHWGYKIIGIASSEEDAISMLKISLPDVIIMDIVPGIILYEIKIIEKIKKMNIPVIFLASYENKYIIEPAMMKDYTCGIVTKPIDVNVLNSAINSALTLPSLEGRGFFSVNHLTH